MHRFRFLPPLIAVLLGLLMITLISLPLALEWSAERWLRGNGAANAEIADIDLDLFDGRMELRGLDAGAGDDEARLQVDRLYLDIGITDLFDRRILVEALILSGARIDVTRHEDGAVQVGPVTLPRGSEAPSEADPASEDAEPWGFGSEQVAIDDVEVRVLALGHDVDLRVPHVRIDPHASWEPSEPVRVQVGLSVDGAVVDLELDAVPWSTEPTLEGRLRIDQLSLPRVLDLLPVETSLTLSEGTLAADTNLRVTYTAQGTPEVRADGWLRLRGLDLGAPLTRAGADADASSVRLRLHDAALDLSARFDGATDTREIRYELDADLDLTGLGADAETADLALFGARTLTIDDIRITDSGSPSFGALSIDDLLLAEDLTAPATDEDAEPVLAADAVRIDAASFGAGSASDPEIAIGRIGISGLRTRLLREADGTIAIVDRLLALVPGDPEAAVPEAPADAPTDATGATSADPGDEATAEEGSSTALAQGPGQEEGAPATNAEEALPALRVGEIDVTGEEWFAFEDRAVTPRRRFQFDRLELNVENLDTRGATFPLRFFTRERTGAEFELTAEAVAGGPTPGLDGTLRVDNLYLTEFSPYIPGYAIDRGRFSTDTRITISGMNLDVQNALSIDGLKFVGDGGDGTSVLDRGMAMPLDAALDLLRDREDRIRFDLPVTGRLDAPDFGTGDIVRLAMQKALQRAAFSYVKNALQPLGTLLMVGDLAMKAARPRFEPVVLEAGASRAEGTSRDYLERIRSMLVERPGLQLTVCGIAAEADRRALLADAVAARDAAPAPTEDIAQGAAGAPGNGAGNTEENAPDSEAQSTTVPETPIEIPDDRLLELAEQRTIQALDFLTEPDTVGRERLYTCRARIASGDDDAPGIQITL